MTGLPFDTTASAATATFSTRPVVMGTRGVVTSGHYLATAAGFRIMEQGGNAFDAAAAMCFCVNLLEPQSNGIGGEVPVLVYSANEKKVFSISGMGWSPQECVHFRSCVQWWHQLLQHHPHKNRYGVALYNLSPLR